MWVKQVLLVLGKLVERERVVWVRVWVRVWVKAWEKAWVLALMNQRKRKETKS